MLGENPNWLESLQISEKELYACRAQPWMAKPLVEGMLITVAILGGFLRFPETSQNWAGARARASS